MSEREIGQQEIEARMWQVVCCDGVAVDSTTNEVNVTKLAEYVADFYGHAEWLDDDLHCVWDAAVNVAALYDRRVNIFRIV